jgi:hypothetical protein
VEDQQGLEAIRSNRGLAQFALRETFCLLVSTATAFPWKDEFIPQYGQLITRQHALRETLQERCGRQPSARATITLTQALRIGGYGDLEMQLAQRELWLLTNVLVFYISAQGKVLLTPAIEQTSQRRRQ